MSFLVSQVITPLRTGGALSDALANATVAGTYGTDSTLIGYMLQAIRELRTKRASEFLTKDNTFIDFPAPTAIGNSINLPDKWVGPLQDFIVYRCKGANSASKENITASNAALASWLRAVDTL